MSRNKNRPTFRKRKSRTKSDDSILDIFFEDNLDSKAIIPETKLSEEELKKVRKSYDDATKVTTTNQVSPSKSKINLSDSNAPLKSDLNNQYKSIPKINTEDSGSSKKRTGSYNKREPVQNIKKNRLERKQTGSENPIHNFDNSIENNNINILREDEINEPVHLGSPENFSTGSINDHEPVQKINPSSSSRSFNIDTKNTGSFEPVQLSKKVEKGSQTGLHTGSRNDDEPVQNQNIHKIKGKTLEVLSYISQRCSTSVNFTFVSSLSEINKELQMPADTLKTSLRRLKKEYNLLEIINIKNQKGGKHVQKKFSINSHNLSLILTHIPVHKKNITGSQTGLQTGSDAFSSSNDDNNNLKQNRHKTTKGSNVSELPDEWALVTTPSNMRHLNFGERQIKGFYSRGLTPDYVQKKLDDFSEVLKYQKKSFDDPVRALISSIVNDKHYYSNSSQKKKNKEIERQRKLAYFKELEMFEEQRIEALNNFPEYFKSLSVEERKKRSGGNSNIMAQRDAIKGQYMTMHGFDSENPSEEYLRLQNELLELESLPESKDANESKYNLNFYGLDKIEEKDGVKPLNVKVIDQIMEERGISEKEMQTSLNFYNDYLESTARTFKINNPAGLFVNLIQRYNHFTLKESFLRDASKEFKDIRISSEDLSKFFEGKDNFSMNKPKRKGISKYQLERYNQLSEEQKKRLIDKYMKNLASIFKENPESLSSQTLLQTALHKWEADSYTTDF